MTENWKPLLAPALLVAVALAQFAHVWTSDLTPWKGGGFGMFATGDSLAGRYLRVYLEDTRRGERRQTAVDMPRIDGSSFKGLYDRAIASPSQERLTEIAASVASLKWAYFSDLRDDNGGESGGDHASDEDLQWSAPTDTQGDDARAPWQDASGTRAFATEDRRVRDLQPSANVEFDAVRVELWRFMLEPQDSTVSAGPVAVARMPRGARPSSSFRRFRVGS